MEMLCAWTLLSLSTIDVNVAYNIQEQSKSDKNGHRYFYIGNVLRRKSLKLATQNTVNQLILTAINFGGFTTF